MDIPIVMKFCTEFSLIYISVEFEDGLDPPKILWFSALSSIFSYGFMENLVINSFF